jgi:hypothetical protein
VPTTLEFNPPLTKNPHWNFLYFVQYSIDAQRLNPTHTFIWHDHDPYAPPSTTHQYYNTHVDENTAAQHMGKSRR